MIAEVASALEMSDLQTRILIRSMSEDITVSLIATLWSDDTPGDHHNEKAEEETSEDVRTDSEAQRNSFDNP